MLSSMLVANASWSGVCELIGISLLCGILSCAIYNAFFHPLAHYPGPWLARISQIYNLIHAYRGDLHVDILRCHKRYGNIVRYAPNRLLFNSVEALKGMLLIFRTAELRAKVDSVDVYCQSKSTQKSEAYNPHPYYPDTPNLFACVDKSMFAWKKWFINQAINKTMVLMPLPRIRAPAGLLLWIWVIGRTSILWMFVSDLVFGESLGLLKKADFRWLVQALTDGNRYMYLQFAWPQVLKSRLAYWVNPSRWIFPAMPRESESSTRLSCNFREQRKLTAKGMQRKDITAALEAAVNPSGQRMTEDEIWTEALTLLRAGGDTVSTALAATFFYLSRNPESYKRLAHEIRSTFPTTDSISHSRGVCRCRYLRACLDEAMRLSPPAPGSFWREVTGTGALIDKVFVPAGYEVGVGIYALHHNERYFSDPYAFRPERFLGVETLEERRNMIQGVNADVVRGFAPFLLGPRACPARGLAYLEMSICLARIMWSTDFRVAGIEGQGQAGAGLVPRFQALGYI